MTMKDLLMFAPNFTETDTVIPETINMFAARLISDNVPPAETRRYVWTRSYLDG